VLLSVPPAEGSLSVSGPHALRAPAGDGAVVAEPALGEVGALLALNRRRLDRAGHELLGRPWPDLQLQARRDAVAAAHDYLNRFGEPLPAEGSTALLMAGHQPELFHPGVWVKHFALQGLARQHGLTSLNLVVDNDTVKSTALRVPARSTTESARPHALTVPFDHWTGEVPYEERAIQDADLFASFGDRAATLLQDWGYRPLLGDFWAEVRRQTERTRILGECFAAARRAFERRWGCHNREVPVSALCRTEPFAWFAGHLLAELPRFHALYNDCVHDYRRLYGIRSRNHPVPDLVRDGEWLEAPFWTWRAGSPRRGRLFVRRSPSGLELRAGEEPWPTLPLPPVLSTQYAVRSTQYSAPPAVAAFQDLERKGFKVRSRALTNTLYARLFLADLFIHGIGGGKYDELTDELIRRFYEMEPPAYLVLSATRYLPLPIAPVGPDDKRRLVRELRDVHYNPQRHLDGAAIHDPALRTVAAEKREWIERQSTDARERRHRFEVLRALTERLRAPLAERERFLAKLLNECEHQLEANAVLKRRDYAFCLYPEETLRPFCTRFL
jgi:hypothetical protein